MKELDPELLAQKKKLQIEVMLKDSDAKKIMRAKLLAEVSIRELKHKLAQIQQEMILKENELKKCDAGSMQLQNELIKLKHKINNLGR